MPMTRVLLGGLMTFKNAGLLALTFCLAGCAVRKIPNTEIDDNDDTRAIIDVIEQYRRAVLTKNAQTIVDLADEEFLDDGGSASPDDDLEYKTLFTVLPARLKNFDDIKLEIAVRKIEIDKDGLVARATYTYSTSWKMPALNPKTQSDSEIKQMTFKLADKAKRQWKITSGI